MLLTYISNKLKGYNVLSDKKEILLKRRYIIHTSRFGLYLHKCTYPDVDPNLFHDHPWSWSFSIILSGWYTEVRPGYDRPDIISKKRIFSINYLSRDTFHRLSEISEGGVWTLYFRGRAVKKDGFLIRQENGEWQHVLAENSDYESIEVVQ